MQEALGTVTKKIPTRVKKSFGFEEKKLVLKSEQLQTTTLLEISTPYNIGLERKFYDTVATFYCQFPFVSA
jgi:hypothetical protein